MRDASPWNITNYQYHPHPQCWNDSYTYITYQPHTHTHRCVVNTHTNTQLNVLITITLPPHCRCLIHSAYLRKQKKQVTTLGPKIIEHTHSHTLTQTTHTNSLDHSHRRCQIRVQTGTQLFMPIQRHDKTQFHSIQDPNFLVASTRNPQC